MTEEAAFWETVKAAAANLRVEILVGDDGRMSLRHKKHWGDPERPKDAEVETFRDLLSRNRDRILAANGIKASEASGIALDARRFKEWLEAHADAPDCVLADPRGATYRFHDARRWLLRTYKEEAGWVLEAYRFQKAVREATSWSLT